MANSALVARVRMLTSALAAGTVGVAFCDNVASIVRVEGTSMAPTLNPNLENGGGADWVLMDKLTKVREGGVRGLSLIHI